MVISSSLKKEFKKRIKILNLSFFKIGDIIKVSYLMSYKVMIFKGVCIAKKMRMFFNRTSSFILRSSHTNVALELSLSLFNVKIFNIEKFQYEKKRFYYGKSKLYYLRGRSKKAVIVKYWD
jgi:ribosomal protein L19